MKEMEKREIRNAKEVDTYEYRRETNDDDYIVART